MDHRHELAWFGSLLDDRPAAAREPALAGINHGKVLPSGFGHANRLWRPMPIPKTVRLYHIVHIDRLASIIADGFLWSDAQVRAEPKPGTTIGMGRIKDRRLELPLTSQPGLMVGACVPFYFGPRSVMLYMLYCGNQVDYRGGQEPIVHLVVDLHEAVAWAEAEGQRWAFTTSNAASSYFDDHADLGRLDAVDWDAVRVRDWRRVRDAKQAEFLVEHRVPWSLVRGVGVQTPQMARRTARIILEGGQQTPVKAYPSWYY